MARLIAHSGQLTPDIRLGHAISEFGAALEGDQKANFSKLRLGNAAPEASDIAKLCESINDKVRKSHQSHKIYGTWIQHALGSIQTLAAVGDVAVGSSQSPIAGGIWAVVRTSLLFAVTYLSLFEKIAEMLMRVGRTASIHRHLVDLFRRESILRDMACEYLIIVVELCQSFVKFRGKAAVARFVATFDMDRQLHGFEDRLTAWATLINEQVQLLQNQLAVEISGKLTLTQKSHKLFSTSHSQQSDRWHCLELIRYLSPHQEEFEKAWRRQRRKGTVNWVFDAPEFQSWAEQTDPHAGKHFLFLTGGLGMGKTVAMANIVGRLLQDDQAIVIYHFVERQNTTGLDGDVVLRSLAHQFIKSVSNLSAKKRVTLPSAFTKLQSSLEKLDVGELIHAAISHKQKLGHEPFYIVLDGLGHLDDSDVQDIVSALEKCAIHSARIGELKICLSLRSGSALKSAISESVNSWVTVSWTIPPNTHSTGQLQDHLMVMELQNPLKKGYYSWCSLSVAISPDRNSLELHDYIMMELDDRPGFRELSKTTQTQIQESIWSLADGMYLWASLQIDHLFPRYSRKVLSVQDVMGLSEHLPHPLSELYDAAIMSIIDSKDQPTFFQLAIAARRPLTISELLVALSLTSEEWEEENIALCHDAAAKVYECSGGILELDEEYQTVHFVHNSAYVHLTSPTQDWKALLGDSPSLAAVTSTWNTSVRASDLCMGRRCLRYLDLPIHERQVTKTPPRATVDSSQTISHIQHALSAQSAIMKYAGRLLRRSTPTSAKVSIDLARVAEAYLEDQKKLRLNLDRGGSKIQPTEFLNYASSYWLIHSDHFLFELEDASSDDAMNAPFLKVLHNECAANVELPFDVKHLPSGGMMSKDRLYAQKEDVVAAFQSGLSSIEVAMSWAYQHKHLRLFWALLDILDLTLLAAKREDITVPIAPTLTSLFPCKFYKRTSKQCQGFPLDWDTNSSLAAGLDLPFLCQCRLHSRSDDTGRPELDAEAILHTYILGKCSLGSGVRYVLQTQMWKIFQNPLLEHLPQWKHIICRVGSFYTINSADDARKLPDEVSLRQQRLSEWAAQESIRELRTHTNHNTELILDGLDCMRGSLAFQYFLPIISPSWQEGYFVDSVMGSTGRVWDIQTLLMDAGASCHLRDPQGLTPLSLMKDIESDMETMSDIPTAWADCKACIWADHRPGTAGSAAKLCLTSLMEQKCSNGPISNEDIFGLGTRMQMKSRGLEEISQRQRYLVQLMRGAGARFHVEENKLGKWLIRDDHATGSVDRVL